MILEMVLATEASHSVSVWSWLLGPVQNQHVRITGLRWWLGGLKRGGQSATAEPITGALRQLRDRDMCFGTMHRGKRHVRAGLCRATSHSVRSGTGVGSSDHAIGTPEDVKVARAIKLVLEGEAWDVEPLFSMRPMQGRCNSESALARGTGAGRECATFFLGGRLHQEGGRDRKYGVGMAAVRHNTAGGKDTASRYMWQSASPPFQDWRQMHERRRRS